MDKKTLPLIIILVLAIIFFWPIMEFLGFVETPEPTTSEQVVDTLGSTTSDSSPLSSRIDEPTDQNWVNQSHESITTPEIIAQSDSLPVDSIIIETNCYRAILSTFGGGPVNLELKQYNYRDGNPIQMLPDLIRVTPEVQFAGGTFSTSQLNFSCNDVPGTYDVTRQSREIAYTFTGQDGSVISRKFVFYPDKHHFDFILDVNQPSSFGFERKYTLFWNTPLSPTEPDLNSDYSSFEVAAMMGGSREKLDDYKDDVLDQSRDGNVTWAGIRSKYFSATLIPKNRPAESVLAKGRELSFTTAEGNIEAREVTVGIEMPFMAVNPIADTFSVFVGPLDYMMMEEYGVDLEDMLDIGTFPVIGWLIKPFAVGIMWLLPKMYDFIPNYGIVIILFALLVKIITLPLSLKSFKSMQAMKTLQPKMEEMKKKYKKDPQKLNQEMMKLYKTHGVNPISGCLPMLPQMPLFFALFSVFRATILLRDAPFFWFIDDLSRGALGFTDPYIILVLLMVGAQFISQKLTMASTQQNKMLIYMMPLLMGFIFYKFAAGLVLYWTAFSLLSLLDYAIFRRDKNNQVKTA